MTSDDKVYIVGPDGQLEDSELLAELMREAAMKEKAKVKEQQKDEREKPD